MYDLYIMRRTQIYLDEGQAERLAVHAETRGKTLSALIREAIDDLLDGEGSNVVRLGRFRDALIGASGVAPELPSGATYVDELRALDAERERQLRPRPKV